MLDEQLDHVVREVALGDEVLTAYQRLYRGVWCDLLELAKVLPGVLVDAELCLERRAAEGLHGGEADGVHLGRDRQDLVGAQVTAEQ